MRIDTDEIKHMFSHALHNLAQRMDPFPDCGLDNAFTFVVPYYDEPPTLLPGEGVSLEGDGYRAEFVYMGDRPWTALPGDQVHVTGWGHSVEIHPAS